VLISPRNRETGDEGRNPRSNAVMYRVTGLVE
jgi:hypothetical protein